MSRRLINRAGGTQLSTQASIQAPTSEPYQTPSFPLNEAARTKLGVLARDHATLSYQNQLKEVFRYLSASIYDLQSRLQYQREKLEKMRQVRQEKGTEKSPEEERLEIHVPELEREVAELTNKSETAVRNAIDQKVALEDNSAVLGELYTKAVMNGSSTQQPTEDEVDIPSAPSTLDTYRTEQTKQREAYASHPPSTRYAKDNDYIAFKKQWYDGLAGDEGPPLPDALKWFRADGTPVMGTTLEALGGYGDDSDDDIAVAREVLSNNCPLTLRVMDEPYSNRKCKHTFEKSAILDYLGHSGSKQCPQSGCSQVCPVLLLLLT